MNISTDLSVYIKKNFHYQCLTICLSICLLLLINPSLSVFFCQYVECVSVSMCVVYAQVSTCTRLCKCTSMLIYINISIFFLQQHAFKIGTRNIITPLKKIFLIDKSYRNSNNNINTTKTTTTFMTAKITTNVTKENKDIGN